MILEDIKKLLGIPNEFEKFDKDILIHLNSVGSILNQLGVNTVGSIDSDTDWKTYIPEINDNESLIKSWMHMKVRILFDPPTGSIMMNALKENTAELEWRINNIADYQRK